MADVRFPSFPHGEILLERTRTFCFLCFEFPAEKNKTKQIRIIFLSNLQIELALYIDFLLSYFLFFFFHTTHQDTK